MIISASGMAEFISFSIGADRYGVDIMAVREIRSWTDVARLPNQPEYMRGVLNLRGAMVPIVDLRCRFGQGVTETTAQHVVIVVQIGNRQVGMLCDRVLDIVAFEAKKIQPVPQVAKHAAGQTLAGLIAADDGMIAIIELANLVSASDVAVTSPAQAA